MIYYTLSKEQGTIHDNQDEKPTTSLAAIIGRMEPRTLKFKGSINDKNVTILIDFESTHNFVDIDVAKQPNLFIFCEEFHGYNC